MVYRAILPAPPQQSVAEYVQILAQCGKSKGFKPLVSINRNALIFELIVLLLAVIRPFVIVHRERLELNVLR